MAANHVAIGRSSARSVQQKLDADEDNRSRNLSEVSKSTIDQTTDDFSVISLETNEATSQDIADAKSASHGQKSKISKKVSIAPKPLMAPLDHLNSEEDINACVDSDLQQINVLNKLEQDWSFVVKNFAAVISHLQECSDQVTDASTNCLKSLVDCVETTCDSVDGQVKALYLLMTKCDELTTKLSAASLFRDEIKTLRKSVETLENLYRSRPATQPNRTVSNT